MQNYMILPYNWPAKLLSQFNLIKLCLAYLPTGTDSIDLYIDVPEMIVQRQLGTVFILSVLCGGQLKPNH